MSREKSVIGLLHSISYSHLTGPDPSTIIVDGVVADSREVSNRSLFIAIKGEHSDGHNYINQAIKKKCRIIIVEKGRFDPTQVSSDTTCILMVNKTREILAHVVAEFYDNPQKSLHLIGITGTNGKTTISYMLESILIDQGKRVGVIGTVDYRYTDRSGIRQQIPAPLTTPDPIMLQRQLHQMVEEGVEYVIMEVSSHALDQKRLWNIQFNIAAFSNLTHDHLDYHGTMEQYFQAKTLLFTAHLQPTGKAVITFTQADSIWSAKLLSLLEKRGVATLICGKNQDALIQATKIEIHINRTDISLSTPVGELLFSTPLVGRFNVDNIITALAIISTMGVDIHSAVKTLKTVTGAPGRLERVELSHGAEKKAAVFVDYAHTPDALLNVLSTLKDLPHKRLYTVFGCGGDRDTTKRPEMGRIAAEFSDCVIVTDDNPRSESSETIIHDIIAGIKSAGMEVNFREGLTADMPDRRMCAVIPDRSIAIHEAIMNAAADDLVVIAGKGHEKYQLTPQGRRYFDDCLEARKALSSWDTESLIKALGVNPIINDTFTSLAGVSTDSRNIKKNEIFIALTGESFDGHDYVNQVLDAGAGCIIISDPTRVEAEVNVPVFQVTDTLEALGDLARYRRLFFSDISKPLIVGITGSCGKTTVKEMVAAIFEKRWPDHEYAPVGRVLRTKGNYNNLIGLPLSLLPIQCMHQAAVLEMGMNQSGEISRLTEIAQPGISCITNVHGAHLEGLGSIAGVAQAKEELFAGTGSNGTLVVNLDDEFVVEMLERYPQKKVCFTLDKSRKKAADIWAADIRVEADGNSSFTLHIGSLWERVFLRVPGKHNVANCLAAAAIAHTAGTDMEVIVAGLMAVCAPDKRLEVILARKGYSVINDTYNANPASMVAGLATLSSMSGHNKIAVLGDMLELGEASENAHEEIGRIAADCDLHSLAVCGTFAEFIAQGARSAGLSEQAIHVFSEKKHINIWLEELEEDGILKKGSWVLVKASRGMRFETVVDKIAEVRTSN